MTARSVIREAPAFASQSTRAVTPAVSIGLPVYNGENFVEHALRSLLEQTFEDFEVVISDNASTDGTEAICRDFAARDARVRYTRSPSNLGAAPNYHRVFHAARGRYFKWAAHDDVCRPDFLRTCVEVLEADETVVLAFPRTATIDHTGRVTKEWPPRHQLEDASPVARFAEALEPLETHPIWGVMRTEALGRTPLLGSYPGHDLPLLAELALLGRFHQVQDVLFLQREHRDRSVRAHDFRDPHRAVVWYDPSKAGKLIFPQWRLLGEYAAAIRRAPLRAADRWRCLRLLAGWTRSSAPALVGDLEHALERLPAIRRPVRSLYRSLERSAHRRRWRQLALRIEAATTPADVLLLAGDCWFEHPGVVERRTLPFLERDGQYNGLPADGDGAVDELRRMQRQGATHIVFAQPAFWWLDYYGELAAHLARIADRVIDDPSLVLFDLRGRV